jgi:hypothetical protein
MNPMIPLKRVSLSLSLIALALVCFAFAAQLRAVSPPPKGGYSSGNTADAQNKLAVAAQTLTTIIGAKVLPRDVKVIESRQIFSWRAVPDFARPCLARSDCKIMTARYHGKHSERVRAVFFEVPEQSRSRLMNASLVAAWNADMAGVETCPPVRICLEGKCQTFTPLAIAGRDCGPSLCNSDADCKISGEAFKDCWPKSCSPLGFCSAMYVKVPKDQACPEDTCTTHEECGSGSTDTKICTYKKCEGQKCKSVEVEVPKDDPCPDNECVFDSDCKDVSLGGISIFEDIYGDSL